MPHFSAQPFIQMLCGYFTCAVFIHSQNHLLLTVKMTDAAHVCTVYMSAYIAGMSLKHLHIAYLDAHRIHFVYTIPVCISSLYLVLFYFCFYFIFSNCISPHAAGFFP